MKKNLFSFLFFMLFILLSASGCGDNIKGYYITPNKDIAATGNAVKIVYVDTSDNGGYLLKEGSCYYRYMSRNVQLFDGIPVTGGLGLSQDTIINLDEAFTKLTKYKYKWNGTTVKTSKKYVFSDGFTKASTRKVPKDYIGFKDGKLILEGKTFEKTDKDKIEKEFDKMKEAVKSLLGKEYTTTVLYADADKIKAKVAQIVIVRDGKTETFK